MKKLRKFLVQMLGRERERKRIYSTIYIVIGFLFDLIRINCLGFLLVCPGQSNEKVNSFCNYFEEKLCKTLNSREYVSEII